MGEENLLFTVCTLIPYCLDFRLSIAELGMIPALPLRPGFIVRKVHVNLNADRHFEKA